MMRLSTESTPQSFQMQAALTMIVPIMTMWSPNTTLRGKLDQSREALPRTRAKKTTNHGTQKNYPPTSPQKGKKTLVKLLENEHMLRPLDQDRLALSSLFCISGLDCTVGTTAPFCRPHLFFFYLRAMGLADGRPIYTNCQITTYGEDYTGEKALGSLMPNAWQEISLQPITVRKDGYKGRQKQAQWGFFKIGFIKIPSLYYQNISDEGSDITTNESELWRCPFAFLHTFPSLLQICHYTFY